MAKIKDLKKDINHLTYQVISECYTFLEYSPEIQLENVSDIITDAVELRNELIYRVNNFNFKGDKKKVKEYFRKILDELYDKNIELIDRLNSLGS